MAGASQGANPRRRAIRFAEKARLPSRDGYLARRRQTSEPPPGVERPTLDVDDRDARIRPLVLNGSTSTMRTTSVATVLCCPQATTRASCCRSVPGSTMPAPAAARRKSPHRVEVTISETQADGSGVDEPDGRLDAAAAARRFGARRFAGAPAPRRQGVPRCLESCRPRQRRTRAPALSPHHPRDRPPPLPWRPPSSPAGPSGCHRGDDQMAAPSARHASREIVPRPPIAAHHVPCTAVLPYLSVLPATWRSKSPTHTRSLYLSLSLSLSLEGKESKE